MVQHKALIVIIPVAVATLLGFFAYEKFVKKVQEPQTTDNAEYLLPQEDVSAWDDLPGGDVQDGLITENSDMASAAIDVVEKNATPSTNIEVASEVALINDILLNADKNPLLRLALSQEAPLTLFVKAVDMISNGESPVPLLGFISDFGPFHAKIGNDGYLAATAATSSRFNPWVNALTAMPPKNAANWFIKAEPRLQEILDELGYVDAPIRQKFTRAMTMILQIPDFNFEPELIESRPGIYVYKDSAFNDLNDAQKAIVRLGFRNCAKIKAYTLDLADELKLYR